MSYTTQTAGSRTRILRMRPGTTTHSVTSMADPMRAERLAELLTHVAASMPEFMGELLVDAGMQLPKLSEGPHDFDCTPSLADWQAEVGDMRPVEAVRILLSAYDSGRGGWPNHLPAIRTLAGEEPAAVQRAVREELAHLARPYDGQQVAIHVSDLGEYTWCWTLLATAALGAQSRKALESLARTGLAYTLLRELEAQGAVEVPSEIWRLDEAKELIVMPHIGQMTAWLAVKHPDLVPAYQRSATAGLL